MTSDQDALLRTICEYPFDLRPRLVFADWLDENDDGANGFAARAEFIRLQCEIESKPDADAEGREGFLFRANAARWWPGLPNVTVNLDWFADQNGMRTDEPSSLVCNGFVQEIRCPLSWWIGGECECFTNEPDAHCPTCHGTGRTPANGPAVVSRQPVTRVVVSDADLFLMERGGMFWWRDGTIYDSRSGTTLPPDACPDGEYPTREAAVEALSRALVDWARKEAGLTPTKWEVIQ